MNIEIVIFEKSSQIPSQNVWNKNRPIEFNVAMNVAYSYFFEGTKETEIFCINNFKVTFCKLNC